ncbi:YvrJ family protein [Lagierella sp.]|nr:YvrJ family protein [Lagierella sp.]
MTEVLEYVSNIGFPIVLSLFLITRIESKLEVLSESIKELSVVIQNMK